MMEEEHGKLKQKSFLKCKYYDADADNMILMKEHIREIHEYPCPLCGDKIVLLKGHMRKVHEYQCHICGAKFKDQDQLNLHEENIYCTPTTKIETRHKF